MADDSSYPYQDQYNRPSLKKGLVKEFEKKKIAKEVF